MQTTAKAAKYAKISRMCTYIQYVHLLSMLYTDDVVFISIPDTHFPEHSRRYAHIHKHYTLQICIYNALSTESTDSLSVCALFMRNSMAVFVFACSAMYNGIRAGVLQSKMSIKSETMQNRANDKRGYCIQRE